ncbi:fatty acid desaturase-domain-containing protein [Phycomyces nitens]|nr:fatty acid desaturase-domain-containing protein [Phycomyces nitens]
MPVPLKTHIKPSDPVLDLGEAIAKGWEIPEFTIKEIRDSIPAHCFERNTFRSFSYVLHDLCFVALWAYCASWIDVMSSGFTRVILWSTYGVLQSIAGSALWVLAHECGHRAFSPSILINDTVGMIIHSSLLVPYHSWKYTHGKHHKSIGHLTKDKIHYPKQRSAVGLPPREQDEEADGPHSIFEDSPIVATLDLLRFLFFAWPLYLLFNLSGDTTTKRWVSHFNPNSYMFREHQFWKVVQSTAGVLAMIGILICAGQIFGSAQVFKYYIIPYICVNFSITMITYLQHTSPYMPRYDTNVWNFQRGAALTIDRSYGFIIDHLSHHIADTHVMHHFVSTMPHYHCVEATKHVRKVLGNHYYYDPTPILKALYENWTQCKFVEDEGSVRFYKR